ncbi:hypothetical protein P608_18275 [Comamonas thiooxydans]|uniref:Uncharacterized protein n=1 Tax=Comamonas thiooxydans TaxID=363952 RepID=A0A0E3BXM5_9BURK|nr:hypothetical protein [Comamonas thiooxydans]KGH08318.1 hypothetical protein P608_18275 [Comamonas thiooxydans]KGH13166.1 hypothetical protein P607_24155 [Comamonas thiooxydans]
MNTIMTTRTSLRQFERDLQGISGNITLYRRGINEFYLSQYSWIYEQLEAVRPKLEAIGMYERCHDALQQVEAWVQESPEHDEEAELLLLNLSGDLRDVSGIHSEMRQKLKDNPSAIIEDFKTDPDGWLLQEPQEKNDGHSARACLNLSLLKQNHD